MNQLIHISANGFVHTVIRLNMPPDPGKSPTSPHPSPADSFQRPDTSDEDFDDDEEYRTEGGSEGYEPLATDADIVPEDCDDDSELNDELDATSRVVEHIRSHMMPVDDLPDVTDEAISPSDHVAVSSFQLSNGKLLVCRKFT